MPATTKGLRGSKDQAKTRLLLALWDMGGTETAVKKGELAKRIQRTNERAADYQGIFEQLEKSEAIAFVNNKISLSDNGVKMLGEGLKTPEFQFDSVIGQKTANALLKWMRQMGTIHEVASPAATAKTKEKAIASYNEFKSTALQVYDQLNRDYNLNNLVPIYRIRRAIGDRVSRSHFNEWILEMQATDIFQLMGGEMPDITPDKAEDSITTELSGLRYYAKQLKA